MGSEKPEGKAPPHVLEYLSNQNTLTLATASPSGVPHAATMVYVSDGMTLFFCTRPDTTTARNIEQNPAVAFAIDEYSPDWSKTKGIQGEGECEVLLNPADIKHVVERFQQRFPFLAQKESAHLAFYRIVPARLQFIDNQSPAGDQAGQTLGMEYRRSLAYSVFRALPRQEVETLAAKLDTARFEPGEIIVRQGAPADKFFIIVEGEVEVVQEGTQSPRTVAILKRGQFFGEVAILRDTPRMATVRAVTATTLLTMDRDAFRGLVAQSLATTEDFDRVIRQRLGDTGSGS